MTNKIDFVSDLVFNLLNEDKSRWFWLIGSMLLVGFLEIIQGKNIILPFYGALIMIHCVLIGDVFVALRNKLLPGSKFYFLLLLSFLIHLLFLFMYPKAREVLVIFDSISFSFAVILTIVLIAQSWWVNR